MSMRRLTRADRRREYYHLLAVIEKNTGGRQPAMASATSVMSIAKQNGVDDPKRRLRATIENGDVVVYGGRVCRARVDDLRAAIGEENMRSQPDHDKLACLVAALREVRDD